MKKKLLFIGIVIVSVILVFIFLLTIACNYLFHDGEGELLPPFALPNTKWVCEKYNASFCVDEDGNIKDGVIIIDGESINFDFIFSNNDYSFYTKIYKDNREHELLNSTWSCTHDYFSVCIKDTKGYFKQKSITMDFKIVSY
jgi:hypothetical protein